jgi:hypothetical protein
VKLRFVDAPNKRKGRQIDSAALAVSDPGKPGSIVLALGHCRGRVVHRLADLCAKLGHGSDGRNRDKRGDKAVFNRGGTLVVDNKPINSMHVRSPVNVPIYPVKSPEGILTLLKLMDKSCENLNERISD